MTAPYTLLAAKANGKTLDVGLAAVECEIAIEKKSEIVWVHVIAHDIEATRKLLVDQFKLREREVDLALDPETIADVHDRPEVLFVEIPVAIRENGSEKYSQIGLFLGSKFLISVSLEDVAAVRKRFEIWSQRVGSVKITAAGILHGLIDAIVDSYFPVSDEIQDEVELLEDELFEGKRLDIRDALRLKQRMLAFRRHVAPMRDAVNAMLRRDNDLVPNELWPYFHDVYDHTLRLVELTDLDRDILSSILDAHLNIVNNRLNEVMRFLAAVSTILMSISVISGVYGMNFVHMPELAKPWAYPAVLALMAVTALVEWLLFKRKGWL